ncbi:DUF600 domain-containing protein [Peribacillus phoenicis]|uniref:DUF600 domain-containing protein n=1 Tax=unclassified Peribacillus TaxID=2675266 RepID=UPI0039A285A8
MFILGKEFEDYFSELQTDLVAICLEFVDKKADEIYIYGSYEPDAYYFNVFYNVQGTIVLKQKLNEIDVKNHDYIYDVSKERQFALQRIGTEILEEIHKRCNEFNHEMPTEIKLRYSIKNNKLQAKYNYDLVYTNDDTLLPSNIFKTWFKEVSEELSKRN